MNLRQTVVNSDGEVFTDLASFVRYVAYYDRFDHGLRVVKERRKLDMQLHQQDLDFHLQGLHPV